MCSCSGSCNCNSTTIPRGPQGIPGQNGAAGTNATVTVGDTTDLPYGDPALVTNSSTDPSAAIFNFAIPAGPTGLTGPLGPPGINAFTTLIDELPVPFVQPAIGSGTTVTVANNSWMAIGEIIYIGPGLFGTPAPGGFYQVTAKPAAGYVGIKNLGWTIPGTTFALEGQSVGSVGTIVTPSGTIGASSNNNYVLDAKWGTFLGIGGDNDFKTSIEVPANTLRINADSLECQTIFRIQGPIASGLKLFKIRVTNVDNSGTTGSVVYQNNIDLPLIALSTTYATVHMNYKIQYVSPTVTRIKGEAFLSLADLYVGAQITDLEIDKSYLCTSLFGGFSINWLNDQYVTVTVDDEAVPAVTVIHHEVKVAKKII
jgi:hypothetical protein